MGKYDYIITGAGASGLSLLVHLVRSGKFSGKKILLLEEAPKTQNDRTWCFWETRPGAFEEIVYRRWNKIWFHGQRTQLHDISPYEYKLIRGIDFYEHCFRMIGAQPNIELRYGKVEKCYSAGNENYVVFEGEKIHSQYIFNSILFAKPQLAPGQFYLFQHFKGWLVRTTVPAFKPDEATLMDFRVGQHYGTAFVYVMPFSETEALVEYTLFSDGLLKDDQYEEALRQYCEVFLSLKNYEVKAREFGVIPMTNYPFPSRTGNIINIGTAGGQTRASSGYTFQFIQKQSAAIVRSLLQTGHPFVNQSLFKRRFRFYDAVLLNILSGRRLPGADIFNTLFETNSMKEVFRFLDNETSFANELRIIRKLPTTTFLRAALQQIR